MIRHNPDISHLQAPLINTGALARWKMTATVRELFQQFVTPRAKPLKRLTNPRCLSHRAKAPVLMRIRWSSVKYAG